MTNVFLRRPDSLSVETDFGPGRTPQTTLQRRIWRPIAVGIIVFGGFFLGSIAWASMLEIAGAVVAQSYVKVEENRMTVKHRDGGIVRTIDVREGSRVNRGDLLITLDDTQARGQVEVLRSQIDNFLGQRARFVAERDDRRSITFPVELTSRVSDPTVRSIIEDQENLFKSRLSTIEAQIDIQNQKKQQVGTRIEGLEAQIAAVKSQHALIEEELVGVKHLFEQGLALKTKYLQLQRSAAQLEGERGSLIADVTRSKEAIGEANIQISQLRSQRITDAADGLRDVQNRIADATPRLRTAEETLQQIEVRAPASGFVHNPTQFTDGGVIAPGERLLDLVPADTLLVVEARLRPEDISKVGPGMRAHVRLTSYKARVVPTIAAEVVKVSADRLQDPKTGEAYFVAELKIDPDDLRRSAPQVRLYPGMPAEAMIATGDRTVLDYLLSPITAGLSTAMREN